MTCYVCCGNNSFVITDDKPVKQKCKKCGYEEIWRPGEVACVICTKIIAKKHRGHTLYGYPAHRKCMIEYTAWEISQENPGVSESESRILQVRRNLEHLYRRLEIHGNELRNHGHNKTA